MGGVGVVGVSGPGPRVAAAVFSHGACRRKLRAAGWEARRRTAAPGHSRFRLAGSAGRGGVASADPDARGDASLLRSRLRPRPSVALTRGPAAGALKAQTRAPPAFRSPRQRPSPRPRDPRDPEFRDPGPPKAPGVPRAFQTPLTTPSTLAGSRDPRDPPSRARQGSRPGLEPNSRRRQHRPPGRPLRTRSFSGRKELRRRLSPPNVPRLPRSLSPPAPRPSSGREGAPSNGETIRRHRGSPEVTRSRRKSRPPGRKSRPRRPPWRKSGPLSLVASRRHGALQLQEDYGGAVREGRRPWGLLPSPFLAGARESGAGGL